MNINLDDEENKVFRKSKTLTMIASKQRQSRVNQYNAINDQENDSFSDLEKDLPDEEMIKKTV